MFGLALAGVRGGPGELGLAVELHRAKEELEQTKEQLRQTQEELKRRGESLVEAASKLKLCEAELQGAQEERDRARNDIEHSQLSKDEVLAQALQVRARDRFTRRRLNCTVSRLRFASATGTESIINALLNEALICTVRDSVECAPFRSGTWVFRRRIGSLRV